jgi:peptide/nickel transport system ATP-binding protein
MDQVIESALQHGVMDKPSAMRKAVELFRALALPNPDKIGERYPHQVSGGQLQRVMAAMALITDPELVILDEPTTALDVTTQIEVLRAFKKVVKEIGTTAVYVSHDLAVVAQMADRIIVLRDGAVREVGSTEQVLHAPADSYPKPHRRRLPGGARVQLREILPDAVPAEARARCCASAAWWPVTAHRTGWACRACASWMTSTSPSSAAAPWASSANPVPARPPWRVPWPA